MRYGVPYKGSKNQIAEWVVQNLPRKTNFYDLFAGGCAVTHAALLSGKFTNYHANDISDAPELFYRAVSGGFREEKRWISREDFYRLKDTDPYIRYCWSFGNRGENYLYSKVIEPWKKALHYARVFGDFSLLEEFGIKTGRADRITVARNADEWREKYIVWAIKYFEFTEEEIAKYNQYKKNGVFENLVPGSVGFVQLKKRLRSLESLESLERLQSLESLQRLERLVISRGDYRNVMIDRDSVIYCDIPYRNTDKYSGAEFDHDEFYTWAESQSEPVIISEYDMPDDRFECVAEIEKRVLLSATDNSSVKKERLFVPKVQIEKGIYTPPVKYVQGAVQLEFKFD